METDFGGAFIKAVTEISKNPTIGMFIHACFIHTTIYDGRFWSPNSTIKLGNLVSLIVVLHFMILLEIDFFTIN